MDNKVKNLLTSLDRTKEELKSEKVELSAFSELEKAIGKLRNGASEDLQKAENQAQSLKSRFSSIKANLEQELKLIQSTSNSYLNQYKELGLGGVPKNIEYQTALRFIENLRRDIAKANDYVSSLRRF